MYIQHFDIPIYPSVVIVILEPYLTTRIPSLTLVLSSVIEG